MTDVRKVPASETAMACLRDAVDTLYRLHELLVAISNAKTASNHVRHLAELGAYVALDIGNGLDCSREQMEHQGGNHA